LLGGLVAPVFLPLRAEAKTVLKFANSNAPDHPLNIRLKEAAALILEQTNGEVEIRIFPSISSAATWMCCRRCVPGPSTSSTCRA